MINNKIFRILFVRSLPSPSIRTKTKSSLTTHSLPARLHINSTRHKMIFISIQITIKSLYLLIDYRLTKQLLGHTDDSKAVWPECAVPQSGGVPRFKEGTRSFFGHTLALRQKLKGQNSGNPSQNNGDDTNNPDSAPTATPTQKPPASTPKPPTPSPNTPAPTPKPEPSTPQPEAPTPKPPAPSPETEAPTPKPPPSTPRPEAPTPIPTRSGSPPSTNAPISTGKPAPTFPPNPPQSGGVSGVDIPAATPAPDPSPPPASRAQPTPTPAPAPSSVIVTATSVATASSQGGQGPQLRSTSGVTLTSVVGEDEQTSSECCNDEVWIQTASDLQKDDEEDSIQATSFPIYRSRKSGETTYDKQANDQQGSIQVTSPPQRYHSNTDESKLESASNLLVDDRQDSIQPVSTLQGTVGNKDVSSQPNKSQLVFAIGQRGVDPDD